MLIISLGILLHKKVWLYFYFKYWKREEIETKYGYHYKLIYQYQSKNIFCSKIDWNYELNIPKYNIILRSCKFVLINENKNLDFFFFTKDLSIIEFAFRESLITELL